MRFAFVFFFFVFFPFFCFVVVLFVCVSVFVMIRLLLFPLSLSLFLSFSAEPAAHEQTLNHTRKRHHPARTLEEEDDQDEDTLSAVGVYSNNTLIHIYMYTQILTHTLTPSRHHGNIDANVHEHLRIERVFHEEKKERK